MVLYKCIIIIVIISIIIIIIIIFSYTETVTNQLWGRQMPLPCTAVRL